MQPHPRRTHRRLLRRHKRGPIVLGVLACTDVLLLALAVSSISPLLLSLLRSSKPAPPVTLLVHEIQQLGQLHTVRYNLSDVLEYEHALELQGWARAVPGADRLYQGATKNTVLVVADGAVEAGVDLSRVTPASVTQVHTPQGTRLRVRLPRATLYRPEVRVRVVHRRAGLLWKDENIVPRATEEAERRFQQAAYRSDILPVAEANAVRTLTQMACVSGNPQVEFCFD